MYPTHDLPIPMGYFAQTYQNDDSFDRVYILPPTSQSISSFSTGSCANMPATNSLLAPSTRTQPVNDTAWLAVPSFADLSPYQNVSVGINDIQSWSRYSNPAASPQPSHSDCSSTLAPQQSNDISYYGTPAGNGTWRCSYPGCSSKTVFQRGCDLRKHYKRHGRHFFCRHPGCPKSTSGGFSSRKDRGRHEAKHNPSINCGWEGCTRVFSRMDNMRDHLRRVHQKKSRAR